jgi:hypothetical protein
MKPNMLESMDIGLLALLIVAFVLPIMVFYDRLDILLGFYAVWLFDSRGAIKYAIG